LTIYTSEKVCTWLKSELYTCSYKLLSILLLKSTCESALYLVLNCLTYCFILCLKTYWKLLKVKMSYKMTILIPILRIHIIIPFNL
jgi:hypothetical protein